MSEEKKEPIEVLGYDLGDDEYEGISHTAIAVIVRAKTKEEAAAKLQRFATEVTELAEAHPGIEPVSGRPAIRVLEATLRAFIAIERRITAERARRQ